MAKSEQVFLSSDSESLEDPKLEIRESYDVTRRK